MTDPTQAGFLDFVRSQGVGTDVLPDNSPWIPASYNLAVNLVNVLLNQIPNADPTQASLYTLAVYNLGMDRLVNIAQDPMPIVPVPGTNPPVGYWTNTRKEFKINSFTSGIINATSDEGTSVSLTVPDWAKNLTMLDLQVVKTPWGQAYMAIAQQWGPTDWGLS
jgi:hypothetical protein